MAGICPFYCSSLKFSDFGRIFRRTLGQRFIVVCWNVDSIKLVCNFGGAGVVYSAFAFVLGINPFAVVRISIRREKFKVGDFGKPASVCLKACLSDAFAKSSHADKRNVGGLGDCRNEYFGAACRSSVAKDNVFAVFYDVACFSLVGGFPVGGFSVRC